MVKVLLKVKVYLAIGNINKKGQGEEEEGDWSWRVECKPAAAWQCRKDNRSEDQEFASAFIHQGGGEKSKPF